ncbi:L-histidine N(alpha)-methyltransferase [Candidatus Pelagibacter sp.]|nr:L-histidine N(alpha)-methyltransferase [Candidatus Pelagibacter sp.]
MSEFFNEVNLGLKKKNKKLNSKWFYDFRGSKLFEKITKLEEYYPTRTEKKILRQYKNEIAKIIGKNSVIIEPGAGDTKKISIFLNTLKKPKKYIPLDISKKYINKISQNFKKKFPKVSVMPVGYDYTTDEKLPIKINSYENVIIFFPGSTIGNFEKKDAIKFLKMLKFKFKAKKIIIGADLEKDIPTLISAYDDKRGVTAQFNKNILQRIKTELGADINLSAYKHLVIYNRSKRRIEMRLKSKKQNNIRINGSKYLIKKNEEIHTENSHKYTLKTFKILVNKAGWRIKRTWVDDKKLFSVHCLN